MERFEVRCAGHNLVTIKFDNAHAATAYVEHTGTGSVTQFMSRKNLPGMLPEVEWKCVGLWTFNAETRIWEKRSIYSGDCAVVSHLSPIGEESFV